MKIKLRDLTSTDDSSEMDTVESAFPNRMAENRALRKVKDNLPATPPKRAKLIRTLATSPRCSKHLNYVIISPEVSQKVIIGERFM